MLPSPNPVFATVDAIEPRTPQTFGNAYELWLPDQSHLERHRLLPTLDPDCYPC
ncbi:hypothetical protein ABIE52_000659 [Rhodococcus sp. OAS809]